MKKLLSVATLVSAFSSTVIAAAPQSVQSRCEDRRPLTMEQRTEALAFRSRLMAVSKDLPANAELAEKQFIKLNEVANATRGILKSNETREKASEYLIYEQLKLSIASTIGLQSAEFKAFHQHAQSIQLFSSQSPRLLTRVSSRLRSRISTWMNQADTSSRQPGVSEARSLQKLIKGEAVLSQLDLTYRMLLQNIDLNKEALADQLALYRQIGITTFGTAAVGGTLIASGPIVASASAAIGATGLVLAGCGIGGVGGGAASILQSQYQVYTDALLQSTQKGTAFSCELRSRLESGKGSQDIVQAMTSGAIQGAGSGCFLSGLGLVGPKPIARLAVGAVGVATSVEVVKAGYEVYLAQRSYRAYLSLQAFEKAHAAIQNNQLQQAQAHLRDSQMHAREAGSHTLNAILAGIVLIGVRENMRQAFETGRTAIIALIANSADNVAVAGQLIKDLATSRN